MSEQRTSDAWPFKTPWVERCAKHQTWPDEDEPCWACEHDAEARMNEARTEEWTTNDDLAADEHNGQPVIPCTTEATAEHLSAVQKMMQDHATELENWKRRALVAEHALDEADAKRAEPCYRSGPIPDGEWRECCDVADCDQPAMRVVLRCVKHCPTGQVGSRETYEAVRDGLASHTGEECPDYPRTEWADLDHYRTIARKLLTGTVEPIEAWLAIMWLADHLEAAREVAACSETPLPEKA